MYNEKKKISNDRYLAKFLTKSIRIPADMVDALNAAAAGRNESTSSYIVQAVRERIERDGYQLPAKAAESKASVPAQENPED